MVMGQHILGRGIYFFEDKLPVLPGQKGFDIFELPPCGQLVSLRNCVISWVQYWSLLLTYWTFIGRSS